MISKNEIKYYSSLLQKKYRNLENKFLVEGKRAVEEGLCGTGVCEAVFVTNQFSEEEHGFLTSSIFGNVRLEKINIKDFKKLSGTINPQGIVAVFLKKAKRNNIDSISAGAAVCLENISDPGNVGTIIRNCDWFGFKDIILSEDSVDVYNPKTVRASMGSIFHTNIFSEENLYNALSKLKNNGYRILCADLNGENVNSFSFPSKYALVFANEANGPSNILKSMADNIITIPRYGNAESLNVANAAAVILSKAAEKNKT